MHLCVRAALVCLLRDQRFSRVHTHVYIVDVKYTRMCTFMRTSARETSPHRALTRLLLCNCRL